MYKLKAEIGKIFTAASWTTVSTYHREPSRKYMNILTDLNWLLQNQGKMQIHLLWPPIGYYVGYRVAQFYSG